MAQNDGDIKSLGIHTKHNLQISLQVLILWIVLLMIVPNTWFDKKRPTKMMLINPIREHNYFEGVGCDRNICTHSLWKWTFYFVLYVWYFMDLPNFPSNISFGYYHCRTCILRTLFPQCYVNLCKSNVKIFCAETFATSQNKFWKMKSYTFDGFGN